MASDALERVKKYVAKILGKQPKLPAPGGGNEAESGAKPATPAPAPVQVIVTTERPDKIKFTHGPNGIESAEAEFTETAKTD